MSSLWKGLGAFVRRTGQIVDTFGKTFQGSYAIADKVSSHQTLQEYHAERPQLGSQVFIAPNASVIGNVKVGRHSSIWYGAILRGHGAILHAATVEDGSLIGMGAILLDGVHVHKGAIVAAGAVVPPGKSIPTGEVWGGSPAKLIRRLEEDESLFIIKSANTYAALAAVHAAENAKTFEEILIDTDRREDARLRDPDYDSHLGILRDPVTREVVVQASHT